MYNLKPFGNKLNFYQNWIYEIEILFLIDPMVGEVVNTKPSHIKLTWEQLPYEAVFKRGHETAVLGSSIHSFVFGFRLWTLTVLR